MLVLGVHGGHDCGVALVNGSEIIYAANEERFTRNKFEYGPPVNSLENCLSETGVRPDEIDLIAVSGLQNKGTLRANGNWQYKKIMFTKGRGLFDFRYVRDFKTRFLLGPAAMLTNLAFATGIPRYLILEYSTKNLLRRRFPDFRSKIVHVGHHNSHVASAYYTCDFEDALCVVSEATDGQASLKLDVLEHGKKKKLATTYLPHSPGAFYDLVTGLLGFNPMIHAGKVMGLAARGDPEKLSKAVSSLMWVEGEEIRISPDCYLMAGEHARTGQLPEVFFGHSREDIAAAFQWCLEDCIATVVGAVNERVGKSRVILAGGTCANVLLNQKIYELESVESIYVHPGMTDVGQALGAALWASAQAEERKGKKLEQKRLSNVFLGPSFDNELIKDCLDNHGLKYEYFDDIHREVAKLLADKKVVARFDGRMEYGPRALGNRSILFHAGDSTVNHWLNVKLDRSEFMPFAPAVLAEHGSRCFRDIDGIAYTSRFMTVTAICTDFMKSVAPAVVHVDNTARPQLVDSENSGFYKILKHYHELTDIPVLINTSFNIHNQPIVCSPEDAVQAFLYSQLPYLAIGNYLVRAEQN